MAVSGLPPDGVDAMQMATKPWFRRNGVGIILMFAAAMPLGITIMMRQSEAVRSEDDPHGSRMPNN
jgi:hypothetical protein